MPEARLDRLVGSATEKLLRASDIAAHCFPRKEGWLEGDTRRRSEQLTSYFENSTLDLQYDYIENIKDGRGYTAGRAGFTTRTGDFLMVVEDYSHAKPGNLLQPHLPRLRKLYKEDSSSTSGLKGIVGHWRDSCKDPTFRDVQDGVVDRLYFTPAMERSDSLGLKTALGRAIVYDTIIQHGDGGDHDGLSAICSRASQACQGDPAAGVDEATWLRAFLKDRRAVLENAADPNTVEVWRESVSRVDAFSQIADSGNFALNGPIRINLPEENLVFEVA